VATESRHVSVGYYAERRRTLGHGAAGRPRIDGL
jgi:hypothetical protein